MSNSIGNLKNSGLQGNNFPWQLKMLQGLQAIYDEVKLPLTCAEDSIRLCDGQGHSLDIQADGSINVNVLGSIPVSLDCNDSITICNSSFTNDGVSSLNVHVTNQLPLEVNLDPDNDAVGMYGYTDINDPDSYTALLVNANGQLDIRPLTCLDQVTVCNTSFNNSSGNSSLNVHVTNQIPLEVNINEANDSILIYGNDGAVNRKIKTDAAGELQVDVLTMPATFAEDTPHVSGNTGAFVLGVRNDLNTAMTNANGDYSPIAVNDKGAVAIQDGGSSITVDGTVAATQSGTWNITNITGTVSLPTGAATETTLAAVNTKLTSTVRTPTFLRPSGVSGSTSAAYSVSFASVGTADAIVGTIVLKPGETLNFDAGALNNTLAPIAYDTLTSGAELIIITLI